MRFESFLKNGTVLSLLIFLIAGPALAESLGWRMDGDGRYPDANPPISWSTEKNVVWKTATPAWSNASPVYLASKSMVFSTNEPDEIFAANAKDGKIVWKDSTSDIKAAKVGAHKDNGWATPTPVTDGSHVFTVFGSGVVAAYTVDGERLWARVVEQPKHKWGHSASPVLAGGHLIVHLLDLIALDPKTGKEVWRAESDVKWGSPVVAQIEGKDVVITPAGDVFQATDGKSVATGIGSLAFSTPVVQDGVVYFIEKAATAVRLPKKMDGEFEQLWLSRVQGSRHYASPVIQDGLIYAVSREEMFSIIDAMTGELVHERDLDLGEGSNSAYPSIAQAGGKIYVSAENGTTVVLEQAREYKEIARNSVEGFRSSPVFVGDRMYLRAFDHLYCFGS